MSKISLALGKLTAQILPDEGFVMSRLLFDGKSILASTPWADDVKPSTTAAEDETTWVSRWRGGWQLCAPTTGQPDAAAKVPAFHGAASQTRWALLERSDVAATFQWTSPQLKFSLKRRWELLPGNRVRASGVLENLDSEAREFGIAEHLILGGELLQGVLSDGASIVLNYPADATVHELDYAGVPTGHTARASEAGDAFRVLGRAQDAKVFALSAFRPMRISASTNELRAIVEWEGLAHALVWQEFATTPESPWSNQVLALGIEPTTTPHGVGSAAPGSPVIGAHSEFGWSTTLTIERIGKSD